MGTTVLGLMLVGITLVDWRSGRILEAGFDYVGSVFLALAAIALLAFATRRLHNFEIT